MCKKFYNQDLDIESLSDKDFQRLKEMVMSQGNSDRKLKKQFEKYQEFVGGGIRKKTCKQRRRKRTSK